MLNVAVEHNWHDMLGTQYTDFSIVNSGSSIISHFEKYNILFTTTLVLVDILIFDSEKYQRSLSCTDELELMMKTQNHSYPITSINDQHSKCFRDKNLCQDCHCWRFHRGRKFQQVFCFAKRNSDSNDLLCQAENNCGHGQNWGEICIRDDDTKSNVRIILNWFY